MEALLRWRHLAPTAPDTLAAIPLSDADPFILGASPAVFFAGCQPAYGTRLVTGVRRPAVGFARLAVFSRGGRIQCLMCFIESCIMQLESTTLDFQHR